MRHIALVIVIMFGFIASSATAAASDTTSGQVQHDAVKSGAVGGQYVTQKEYFDMLRIVLDTSKENNEHLKTVITVGAWLLAFMVALFAFFGYRELQTFLKPLKEKLKKLEADYSEKSVGLARVLENKIHKDIQALIKTGYALNLIEMTKRNGAPVMGDAERKSLLNQAVSNLDKALNQDCPEDPTLIAWIQGHRGYALKRLDRFPEAKEAAISAYECKKKLNESGGTQAFNAACFATLAGSKEEALKWLEIAIKEDGHNLRDAWDDEDFSSLRADEAFKKLVGNGRR